MFQSLPKCRTPTFATCPKCNRVDHLGAALGLRLCDLESLVVVAIEDELLELDRSRNVAPLANVEVRVGGLDVDRLEAAEPHVLRLLGGHARLVLHL